MYTPSSPPMVSVQFKDFNKFPESRSPHHESLVLEPFHHPTKTNGGWAFRRDPQPEQHALAPPQTSSRQGNRKGRFS